MIKITDHSARALARLAEQLKNKPNLAAIISAFVDQIQDLEEALWELYTERNLDNAFGLQLDRLGRLVDEPRNGTDDDTYRLRLKAKMKLDLSSGSIPEIIALLTSNTLTLEEQFPAAFVLRVGGTTTTAAELARILRKAKDAGIKAILEWNADDESTAFAFDDSSHGFDDATVHLGGAME